MSSQFQCQQQKQLQSQEHSTVNKAVAPILPTAHSAGLPSQTSNSIGDSGASGEELSTTTSTITVATSSTQPSTTAVSSSSSIPSVDSRTSSADLVSSGSITTTSATISKEGSPQNPSSSSSTVANPVERKPRNRKTSTRSRLQSKNSEISSSASLDSPSEPADRGDQWKTKTVPVKDQDRDSTTTSKSASQTKDNTPVVGETTSNSESAELVRPIIDELLNNLELDEAGTKVQDQKESRKESEPETSSTNKMEGSPVGDAEQAGRPSQQQQAQSTVPAVSAASSTGTGSGTASGVQSSAANTSPRGTGVSGTFGSNVERMFAGPSNIRFVRKSVDNTTVYYSKLPFDSEIETEYPRNLDDNIEILSREAEHLEEQFNKTAEEKLVHYGPIFDPQKFEAQLKQQKKDDDEDEPIGVSPCGRFFKYNKEVGRGSFKTVFRGLDTQTGVAVAWCELLVSDVL